MPSDDRDDYTSAYTIFGRVEKGTICRVCGRDVQDGRRVHCSDRCKKIEVAVKRLLNWGPVKERVKARDDYTCQECGIHAPTHEIALEHVNDVIDSLLEPLLDDGRRWDSRYLQAEHVLRERYNQPEIKDSVPVLHVDHITRVADGGEMFEASNLQTLCADCHREKTADENATWARPSDEFETRTIQDFIDHADPDAITVDDEELEAEEVVEQ